MKLNLIGPFIRNAPFGTETAFAKGLSTIGVSIACVDPNVDPTLSGLDNTADATVIFKSCLGSEQHIYKAGPGPRIVYQPDDARFSHIKQMMVESREYADLFLSFDDYGAQLATTLGYRASETMLLTADPELYYPEAVERDIDVSFIGSLGDPVAHASRRKMCQIVQRAADTHGWKTEFGSCEDITQVRNIYCRSKVVLNHATDVGQDFGFGFGIQCRHFEVAMTRTCLLSNEIPLGKRRNPDFSTFPNEDRLIPNLFGLLNHSLGLDGLIHEVGTGIPLWSVMGHLAYEDVKRHHSPEHRAAELIDFLKRNS